MRSPASDCASPHKAALCSAKRLSAKAKRWQKGMYPTVVLTATLLFCICGVMTSCAKPVHEEGKVISFEKDIDLHSTYSHITWSPDSRYLAFSCSDKISIVDIEADEIRRIFDCKIDGGIHGITWSPDQKLLAISSVTEIKIVRLADGKVIAGIHIPYEQIRSNPVRFGETAFSEDSSKLLVVSPYNYDYAIINSFDLATGTITPLLLPSLPPLNPPPAQAYEGWKKSPLYSTRFYRYQGHLYFSCQYDRLQEAWAYNFTLPLKKDGSEDMEHYVMPYLIMVADLGDGKRVLSTSVLNFPEKAVQSGVPPPMDRLESNRVSLVDYVPQANVVVLGCFGSRVLDKQGTRTDLFQTLSLQRELLVQFAESWWLSPGGEVLHPNMPLLLCHERVPIDDNLRSVYISTHELDEKVPSKQQFVLYDLLTGKEVDRIDRHKSYPTYNTLIMSGHCFSPDGRHFTYEQDGPVLPIYKVTLSNKEK